MTTRRFGWTVGLSTINTHCTWSASCLAPLPNGVSGIKPDIASPREMDGGKWRRGREGEGGWEEREGEGNFEVGGGLAKNARTKIALTVHY